jgi:c-di-GMP-related signal transduction protein
VARREVPANQLNSLRLLTALSRPQLRIQEIEHIVMADSSLCYRLLRLVNSPLYAIHQHVESVSSALLIVGENEFRKLAWVALSATLSKRQPHALLLLSLQRARFCELVALFAGLRPAEQYVLGLLSVVDAILQLPMATIVNALPLRPAVRAALLGEESPEAIGLMATRQFETGDWNGAGDLVPDMSGQELTRIYAESVHWSHQALDCHDQ